MDMSDLGVAVARAAVEVSLLDGDPVGGRDGC